MNNNCCSCTNDYTNTCNLTGCSNTGYSNGSGCSLWIIIGIILVIFFFCFNDNC